ncbi:TRAP dicarboxylate transporter, DctQ subunit, unknown substrate 6 [hydrothermal vent metagenome]|uniref:Tripartite ATP-independent periplasmic transporters DctQ component domain-containing protein n=1 Tax=hydrothermal vent metagenome TaxID=652676 RepID=A0A3B0XDN4_9ZZZZ
MFNKTLAHVENFIDWTGRTVSWLSLLLVLVTFIVVVLRYVFDSGSIALQEVTTYLHATIFLGGMAYTLQQDAHVRVDIFYAQCSKQTKAWINLFGALFLLLPFMFFISWVSWLYIADSWSVFEGSREAGGLPGVFLLKSLILVMTSLLSLQAFTQIARNIETILDADIINDDEGDD